LAAATSGMPVFLVHHLKHNRVLHERVLLVSVVTLEDPRVEDANRVEVVPICEGLTRIILRYGFSSAPQGRVAVKTASLRPPTGSVGPTYPNLGNRQIRIRSTSSRLTSSLRQS